MTEQQALLIASVAIVLPVMAIAVVAATVGIIHSVRGRRSGHILLTNDASRPAARILRFGTQRKTP